MNRMEEKIIHIKDKIEINIKETDIDIDTFVKLKIKIDEIYGLLHQTEDFGESPHTIYYVDKDQNLYFVDEYNVVTKNGKRIKKGLLENDFFK